MKRKIFSKLLMVALVIAAVGSFVSCKDYDDDINNLQKQIDAAALKSELSALQSTLSTQIAAAQSAADKAATAAAAAQKTADAAATAAALEAVKTAATNAGADAAKALTDAAKAQTSADNAATAAATAQATADNAVAAAGKAQEAADAAQAAADAAKAAAEAAKYDDSALKAAVEKAQEAADAAKAAAAAAEAKAASDLEAAIVEATKAIEASTNAKIAAAVAAAVAELTEKIPADQSEAVAELASKLETLASNQANFATAEGLESAVADLQEKINAVAAAAGDAEALAEIAAATGTLKTAVDELYKAITSIEFVYADQFPNSNELNFRYGHELDNVFGNKKEVNAYAATDAPKTYVAGDSIKAENIFIVRVSPVTADLSTAALKLMNSKGENLDDYVTITAEKYDELLTRANENGLWKVTIVLNENQKIEDVQKATYAVLKKDGSLKSAAVYALAANNSDEAAADRFAITPYDLRANTGKYIPADDFDFEVNGVDVDDIYNRWNGTIEAEDGTIERGEDFWELQWAAKNDAKGIYTPAVKPIKEGGVDGKTANYVNTGDKRKGEKRLEVKVGEPIIISFDMFDWSTIDRYYVLLDAHNAVESNPSELQSWLKYGIEGLGVMKKASEKLTITIPDEAAESDVIGFRVYAVNFDGTLADPDGKAFYVQVGEIAEVEKNVIGAKAAIEAVAKVWTTYGGAGSGAAAFNALKADQTSLDALLKDQADKTHKYNYGFAAVDIDASTWNDGAKVSFTNAGTAEFEGDGTNNVVKGTKVTAKYYLMKDAKTLAGKWSEVNYIAVALGGVENWKDGSTITIPANIQGKDADHHDKLVNQISGITVKKVMPTVSGNNAFSWKEGAGVKDGKITLYFTPDGGWTKTAKNGQINLSTLVNNLDANTAFIFADADNAKNSNYLLPGEAATTETTRVIVDGIIDPTEAAYTATSAGEIAAWTLQIPFIAKSGSTVLADDSKSYINGTKQSDLKVVYNWADISRPDVNTTTTAAAAGGSEADDYLATIQTLKATYSYALAENTYAMPKYSYVTSYLANTSVSPAVYNPNGFAQSDAYSISYETVGVPTFAMVNESVARPNGAAGDPQSWPTTWYTPAESAAGVTANNWNTPVKFTVNNPAVSGAINTTWATSVTYFNLNAFMVPANANFSYAPFVGASDVAKLYVKNAFDEKDQLGAAVATLRTFKVRFVTKSSEVEEYYNALTDASTTDITATNVYLKLVGAAIPLTDIPSQIVVDAVDAFGVQKTIFKGDILLKK